MYNNFAAGINISKKTKYLSYSIMVAAGFNLVSNLIFIPIYGFRAAAWNTLFSYMISAAMIYYHSQKVYPITYEWRRIIIVILSCVGVYSLITISNLYFFQIISEYISVNLFKMFGIVIFVILIYSFKFFNINELDFIKSFVSRKKIN
jgi:O-antigen/teichoic acid export membrane protein